MSQLQIRYVSPDALSEVAHWSLSGIMLNGGFR